MELLVLGGKWEKCEFVKFIPDAFLSNFRAFPLSTSRLLAKATSKRVESHLFLTIPFKHWFLMSLAGIGGNRAVFGSEERGLAGEWTVLEWEKSIEAERNSKNTNGLVESGSSLPSSATPIKRR
jgi:hypothetical protein